MPFVAGESLRARLSREGQLPVDEALRLAREIASALGHAHQHGLVPRDIKPENILLLEGMALVADFGIARTLGTDAVADRTRLTTAAGAVLGTPAYMSPEQASGSSVDARSDILLFAGLRALRDAGRAAALHGAFGRGGSAHARDGRGPGP